MLYGGPLGTYLSGYYRPGSKAGAKSTSPASFPNSTGSSSISGTGGATGIGLNRNRGNPYRTKTPTYGSGSSGASTSSLGTSGTLAPSNSWNNFYTPQTRRRYPDDSSDASGPSRSRYSGSGTASSSTGVGGGPGHYYGASSSVHRSSPSSAPRASPSTASSGGGTYLRNSTIPNPSKHEELQRASTLERQNRGVAEAFERPYQTRGSHFTPRVIYPSSVLEGNNIDYKRLYEAEKQETQEMRNKIESTQQDLKDLKAKIEDARKSLHPGNAEQRRVERRMSEGEEQMKVLEELRASSEKLKAEHRALTRVMSRLM